MDQTEILQKLLDRIDGRFADMERRIDSKFDNRFEEMERRIDSKFDNRFEEMEKSINSKFKNMEDHLSTQIVSLSNVVIESNPHAFLKLRNSPAIVTSDDSRKSAIKEGGNATWTVLRYDESFFAVGSKHCGLYYNTMTEHLSFVSLPDMVVRAGVRRVGFVTADVNSIDRKDDAMIVELKACPEGIDAANVTDYEASPNDLNSYSFCVGQSESGPVCGKNVVKTDGLYLFVEDQGERGNSGTLMIVPANNEINKDKDAKILGVYFGTTGGPDDLGLRPRGVVAPLPTMEEIQFYTTVQDPGQVTHLTVKDGGNPRECKLTQRVENENIYYTLQDGSATDGTQFDWPGVLIQLDTHYCGVGMNGSSARRSK